MDEYGELIGIEELHSAKVTEDSDTAYSTGTNDYLAPAGEITIDAKAEINKRSYDNKPRFATTIEGDTEITITVSNVPCKKAAELTGKPYDTTKGILIDTGDVKDTPYRTLSGRMPLGDGGYHYFQFLKGKFTLGAKKGKTQENGNITVNTRDLNYTTVITGHKFTMPDGTEKGIKGVEADTTDLAFTTGDDFFDQVQTPSTIGAPSAIALSSSAPAANVTNAAVSTKPKLTFNNKIASEAVTLIKTTDGSVVAVEKTYNAAGTELTLTPSANLTAGAVYNIVVAGVTDVYGQELTTSVIKFTCAS